MAITLDGTNGILSPDFEPSSSTTPTNGLFLPAANTVGLATGSTERLRIDSSGNLGLGVTPSTWSQGKAFEISAVGEGLWGNGLGDIWMLNGAYFNGGFKYSGTTKATAYRQGAGVSDGSHSWHVAGSGTAGNAISFTQAMTLDASGFLYLGTTTQYVGAAANFYRNATSSNQRVASFVNNGAAGVNSPAGIYIYYSAAAGGNGSTFLQCADSTTDRLYILGSGNVQNANNSYGAISDISVKENIVDATPKLDDLLKVKIRSFNLKGENVKQIGVVAQELEEVFPGMIEENDNGLKGVKYSVFVPMLVKAIQELTTRLETLENK